MKIAIGQINPTVGDITTNAALIKQFIARAEEHQVQLVVFPELSLIGYPPKDLLLKPQFIDDNIAALKDLAQVTNNCAALVGFVSRHEAPSGRELHNAAALLTDGRVSAAYYKQRLPGYDIFDETRYFEPAGSQQIMSFQDIRIGLTICEDIWQGPGFAPRQIYKADPLADIAREQVDLVINISASPFVVDKHRFRCKIFAQLCKRHQLPLVYANQVGGNDELIFDGSSCAFDNKGELIAQAKDFTEDLLIIDLSKPDLARKETIRTDIAAVKAALVLGLRDFVRKRKKKKVLIGSSGCIDSAVVAALAVEALGAENVLAVALPSRYSSETSLTDAAQLANNLGIKLLEIPIEQAHSAIENTLELHFRDRQPDITEENIQARLRGVILMALSNKFGHLLLTTGNKSELATGYCTLYGDMAGGLAVISDVPKMMVYELARYINRDKEIIPANCITKPPSAELRFNQTDQDSLPPYEQLDEIMQRYVEQEQPFAEIVKAGFDAALVERIINLIDRNEYKRRQAALGLKVTSRAFGFGRRMPIAQNYRPYKR